MTHLVVVDLQVVFADPASPWCAPRFADVLDPVARLVAHYEPEVTFTRFVAPASPVGAWRTYYEQWPFALVPPDARLYDLVDRFAGRQTLDLTTFGKWGPPLRERAGEDLVVAGVSTDCCVLSTVLPAADEGVRVTVAADACAGGDDLGHEQALSAMRRYEPLVRVLSTDALLAGPARG